MAFRDERQDRALLEYRALRKFYAANLRFKTDSTMVVETVFRKPGDIQSVVISHEGSTLIRDRVFEKILEAEGETNRKKDRQQVDITPANYRFTLDGFGVCDARKCYRLKISPKRKDKYSLEGNVWVDSEDFAIVRIQGKPAKRPSFWTLRTEIDRRYRRIDGIWLPVRMDSWSDILIAGRSTLTVEYTYEHVRTETGN